MFMVRKKVTTYMEEDLLRSAKALAVRKDALRCTRFWRRLSGATSKKPMRRKSLGEHAKYL